MKKKVVIAIGILCLCFVLGGAYIIVTMEFATSKLDHLIVLHQVEMLREQLLLNIEKVQSDLNLRDTPHATDMDTVIANVRSLDNTMGTCFDCHQSAKVKKMLNDLTNENVLKKLSELSDKTDEYKESLSRFLTMSANRERTEKEHNRAFYLAEELLENINNMVHSSSAKLAEKTQSSYSDISGTKFILYVIVVMAPFLAAGLGFLFVRELTKPVNALLKATRRLKSGDLDYRVEGLKDEFEEVASSFNDMSASLKEHMHQIQESEKRYRALFESAGDAIFIVETEGEDAGKILDANPAAAEMHGYTVEELLELNLIKDVGTPDAASEVPARTKRILAGERVKAEITHRKKDGTVFPVEISAGLLEYMDHKYILAVDRDISERKEMENLILQSKLEWEDTFDTITDMITIQDREFNIIRANRSAETILGLPPLEVTRPKCYTHYHGSDCPPANCPSCECIETETPSSFEIFEPHLDMFLEIRAMPRFDNNNHLIGLIHVVRDITERKRVEEALQRTEQMKMVGEWATGLVHEIKNPLAGIKGSVEVMVDEVSIRKDDRAILHQAVDEIKRIESLLKNLLNFAKPPKPKLALADINDILDKTIAFALRYPSSIADTTTAINVSKDFNKKLPKTMADPMQMQQVFLNLLLNAIEAMPDGGTLAVKTHYDPELSSIQIMISDTGKGIEKEMIDNIFQPFFTTKRKGTGLGLAITRRLIEQHGGTIYAESNPGEGTIFNILLQVNEVNKEQVA
jgi:PAS domain S-box-containing protein